MEVNSPSHSVARSESCLVSLFASAKHGKNLHVEYVIHETLEENHAKALLWSRAIEKCLRRAHDQVNDLS